MSEGIKQFFKEDLVLQSSASTKEDVFKEVGELLYSKGYVKESFTEGLLEREQDFPTGLDLSAVIEGNMTNVAIPHTEAHHCLDKVVLFVQLEKPLTFNNMIKPTEQLEVKYLFVIVNNDGGNQTNILSSLMDFLTKKENIEKMDSLESPEAIFQFLTEE